MAVPIARAAGARKILVTDRDERRLNLARELGADIAYEATDGDWPLKAREECGALGAEVLLEMSGNARALRQGFAALRNGGTAALLGISARPIEIDVANDIIFKGATVLGINGRLMFQTWYQCESFLLSGKINLERIVTHQITLDDFERGFKLMQSGDAIKVVMQIPQQ
jgi:threonine 3-dehydrogenase